MTFGRPRLFASVAIGLILFFVLSVEREHMTRFLIAWNVATLVDIGLNVVMMKRSDASSIRWRAAITDDGQWVILALAVVAAFTAMGAILVELGIAKVLQGGARDWHYGLAGLTIVSAWVFIHLSFALHYAHQFFDEHKAVKGEKAKLRGGLNFPGTVEPDYWDFLYFSFIIGVASQTADVSISSKRMRRLSLAHSIMSFFFNSAILALTINIAAGLV